MLKTLHNIEPSEAQLVLSELTKMFVPSPYEKTVTTQSKLYNDVLLEIFDSLNLKTDQISSKDSKHVLSLLLDEMTSITLDRKKELRARKRLGEKGELANSQYHIQLGDMLSEFKARGITQTEILKTFNHPDTFMHLLRGQEADEEKTPISLYLKSFKHRQEKLFLLIEAKRESDSLHVSSAWKFFENDIKLPDRFDALSFLKKFVDAYGVEFRIGDSLPQKFVLYEAYPMFNKNDKTDFEVMSNNKDSYAMNFLFRMSPLNVLEVSMAYAINTTKNVSDLKRRGIKIKEKKA